MNMLSQMARRRRRRNELARIVKNHNEAVAREKAEQARLNRNARFADVIENSQMGKMSPES